MEPPAANRDDPEPRGRTVFVNQAAEMLGVSRRTVYYRIRQGKLQTIRARCGSRRVLIESIERLLHQRAQRYEGKSLKSEV